MLIIGYKTSLNLDNMYEISKENDSKLLSEQFESAWRKETDSLDAPPEKPAKHLLRVLWKAFGRDFAKGGAYLVLQQILTCASPMVTLLILTWLDNYQMGKVDDSSISLAFGLVVALFVMQLLTTLFTNWHYEMAQRTGFRFRTSLTMALYKKALNLSTAAKKDHSVGKILNISVTDTNRLDLSCQFFHM
jgi:ATP-binding cassette, subfamily C (CFTR/MRP), member 1